MAVDGGERFRNNRRRGVVDRAVSVRDEQSDVVSTGAEFWLAEQWGQEKQVQTKRPTPCDLIRTWGGSNKPAHLDIKQTGHFNGGLLKFRGPDPEHWCLAYVLVVGTSPADFRIAGWAWGHELARSWRVDLPRPAYYLAQEALRENIDLLMGVTFGWHRKTAPQG